VLAILGPDELVPTDPDEPKPNGLPPYVLEVRRDAAGNAVFIVALRAMAGLVPA
jgi:hypothetical protein